MCLCDPCVLYWMGQVLQAHYASMLLIYIQRDHQHFHFITMIFSLRWQSPFSVIAERLSLSVRIRILLIHLVTNPCVISSVSRFESNRSRSLDDIFSTSNAMICALFLSSFASFFSREKRGVASVATVLNHGTNLRKNRPIPETANTPPETWSTELLSSSSWPSRIPFFDTSKFQNSTDVFKLIVKLPFQSLSKKNSTSSHFFHTDAYHNSFFTKLSSQLLPQYRNSDYYDVETLVNWACHVREIRQCSVSTVYNT